MASEAGLPVLAAYSADETSCEPTKRGSDELESTCQPKSGPSATLAQSSFRLAKHWSQTSRKLCPQVLTEGVSKLQPDIMFAEEGRAKKSNSSRGEQVERRNRGGALGRRRRRRGMAREEERERERRQ